MRLSHFFLILLLTASAGAIQSSQAQPEMLAGDISLTLEGGVWNGAGSAITDEDITLDFICDGDNCQPEIWGYAPRFNQADHSGNLKIKRNLAKNQQKTWQARVKLAISPDPWISRTGEATYDIEFRREGNNLSGSYRGNFDQRPVSGKVRGAIAPHFPQPVPNYRPLQPQEHPRLIFRAEQLPYLRQKAKTSTGQLILAELNRTLAQPVEYEGYVPTAGYHAAGHCFLSLLQQDSRAAETGWNLAEKAMARPSPRLLEQSPTVAGVALAYDLCYPLWNREQRQIASKWLAEEATTLIAGTPNRGWNPTPWSNWNARARGAAGLAALAILEEESLPTGSNPQRLLKIAERNLKRYLQQGIGNRGFGTEGDHYTTEPLVLTVLPFLQAYRTAAGQDLLKNSSAEWLLPHYLLRGVVRDGKLEIPAYGRHYYYAGESLFAVALGAVPPRLLPAMVWLFRCYLHRQGELLRISKPHEAIYAFVNYPLYIAPQNPAQMLDRVLADSQKGFYSFRNNWQDGDDFVASIYLKREPLGSSWSFPDAGSFRIWGLGGRWAVAGLGSDRREAENVLVAPQLADTAAQPIFFQSRPDGSGVVSLQAGNWQRSFAVDYSGASGAPGLFAVADSLEGETAATWVMHAEGKVELQGREFRIAAASGATMRGIFIAPSSVKLSLQPEGEITKIVATGGKEFFVIMTVQKGAPPLVKVSGTGLAAKVEVGKQRISFRQNGGAAHLSLY
jgi:hypothetical protein